MKFNKAVLCFLILCGFSTVASANIISINGTQVNAYQMSDNDFADFYRSNIKGKANNDFAIFEQLVMFLVQGTNGNYGIVSVFNERNTSAASAGGQTVTVDVVGSVGSLVYSDGEDGSGVEFPTYVWATNWSDGFVWGDISASTWDVDFNFSDFVGNLNQYSFLTFDGNNNVSVAASGKLTEELDVNVNVAVSEPGVLSLMLLSMGLLLGRRFATRN